MHRRRASIDPPTRTITMVLVPRRQPRIKPFVDLYLPIANLSVNALVIILLGGGVGLLSGMFGVGGGFLTTPLLIIYGIPPTVAAASSASQVTGASVSGVFAHFHRGGVDVKMGSVLVAGGILGSGAGAWIFQLLKASGQIDTVIGVVYVAMLGSIGTLMARESIGAIGVAKGRVRPRARKRRHHPLVAALPCAPDSTPRASTSRRSRRCCSASSPASSPSCSASAAASSLCRR